MVDGERTRAPGIAIVGVGAVLALAFYAVSLDQERYRPDWFGYQSRSVTAAACTLLSVMYWIVSKQLIVLWQRVHSAALARLLYEKLVFPAAAILSPFLLPFVHSGGQGHRVASIVLFVMAMLCFSDTAGLVRDMVQDPALSGERQNRVFLLKNPPRNLADLFPFFAGLHLIPALYWIL